MKKLLALLAVLLLLPIFALEEWAITSGKAETVSVGIEKIPVYGDASLVLLFKRERDAERPITKCSAISIGNETHESCSVTGTEIVKESAFLPVSKTADLAAGENAFSVLPLWFRFVKLPSGLWGFSVFDKVNVGSLSSDALTWHNVSCAYRKKCALNSSVMQNMTDMLPYCVMDTVSLGGHMAANCSGIWVTNETGTTLQFYVEQQTCYTSATVFHVKTNMSDLTTSTNLFIYYGCTPQTDNSNPTLASGSRQGRVHVYYFDNTTNSSEYDRTGEKHGLVPCGPATNSTSGVYGRARNIWAFGEVANQIGCFQNETAFNYDAGETFKNFTICLDIQQIEEPITVTRDRFLFHIATKASSTGIYFKLNRSNYTMDYIYGVGGWDTANVEAAAGWDVICLRYNETSVTHFLNGIITGNFPHTGTPTMDSVPLCIGSYLPSQGCGGVPNDGYIKNANLESLYFTNISLTNAEIASMANFTYALGAEESPMVLTIKFDDVNATTDSSPTWAMWATPISNLALSGWEIYIWHGNGTLLLNRTNTSTLTNGSSNSEMLLPAPANGIYWFNIKLSSGGFSQWNATNWSHIRQDDPPEIVSFICPMIPVYNNSNASFYATATDDRLLTGWSLFSDESGAYAWARKNQSTLVNNTLNELVHNFTDLEGDYLFGCLVNDSYPQSTVCPSNCSVTVVGSTTTTTVAATTTTVMNASWTTVAYCYGNTSIVFNNLTGNATATYCPKGCNSYNGVCQEWTTLESIVLLFVAIGVALALFSRFL